MVPNTDQKSQDYTEMAVAYRPSLVKVMRAGNAMPVLAQVAGGGRSSARETIGRVAAGAVAKKLLETVAGVEVTCYLNPS